MLFRLEFPFPVPRLQQTKAFARVFQEHLKLIGSLRSVPRELQHYVRLTVSRQSSVHSQLLTSCVLGTTHYT